MLWMGEEVLFHSLSDNQHLLYAPWRSFATRISSTCKQSIQNQQESPATKDIFGQIVSRPKISSDRRKIRLILPITNNCSMRCHYCVEGADLVKPQTQEPLILAQTLQAFHQYVLEEEFDQVLLDIFYGCEPTTKPEVLYPLVESFREIFAPTNYSCETSITTNALISSKGLSRLVESFDRIIVSLDGPANIHDRFRVDALGNPTFATVYRNAKAIYEKGKLSSLSVVVTFQDVGKLREIIRFLATEFPGTPIKLGPVQKKGRGLLHQDVKSIPVSLWQQELAKASKNAASQGITIADHTLRREIKPRLYGCSHFAGPNWFLSLDHRLSCCSEPTVNPELVFGEVKNGKLVIDRKKIQSIKGIDVTKQSQCQECIAKFYCAGGCYLKRERINCQRRIARFVSLLMDNLEIG